jgi:DNA (cytosine-5)-methyltransferase 1
MRSIELFAGCGGLALGMARAGFQHTLIVESDDDAVATLRENQRRKVAHVVDWRIEQTDARGLDFTEFRGIDLLSGGPPCQPFSIGGKHLGPDDLRNMWPQAVRAIRQIRPKAFLLENVRGLFRPAFKRYIEYITLQLSYPDQAPRKEEKWEEHLARLRYHARLTNHRSDYQVLARAINTADYGAPQKRHRAVVMGIAADFPHDWDFPAPTHSQEALVWDKHIEGDYWSRHGIRKVAKPASAYEAQVLERVRERAKKPTELPWVTVRDVIADLPSPTKAEKIPGHWQHPGARTYRGHTGSCLDEPAKALKAGHHGVPGGENMVLNRRGNVRYFTVREMARLQGLSDDFVVTGTWKAATRQLGNAVPTIIGEYVGRAIMNVISAHASSPASALPSLSPEYLPEAAD